MGHHHDTGLLVRLSAIPYMYAHSLRSHSIAHGSPPHFPHRKDAFEQAQWLLTLLNSLPNDNRLVATYEYEEIARE
jgi:hypothetical protein